MIKYTLYVVSPCEPYNRIEDWFYELTAKTDIGARRQANKIIKEQNLPAGHVRICFQRSTDGCKGTIMF